jgi:predicted  nucleic acid-binding Zn-ribbon protein
MTMPSYDDTLEPDPDSDYRRCPDCGWEHSRFLSCEENLKQERLQDAIDRAEERRNEGAR